MTVPDITNKKLSQSIPYRLRISKRAKTMRIAVYHTSDVVVTLPWGVTAERAEAYVLEKQQWILKALEHFGKNKNKVFLKSGRREYLRLKPQALALAKQKLEQWNKLFGFRYNRINIKNQATRWASCSKKGNLNFNYQILRLPEEFLDYLVVHELCHLKEFNHSYSFWQLVGTAIPNHKEIRKQFKKISVV